MEETRKPKIFVWAVPFNSRDMIGYAMAEDGNCLASHMSSSVQWAWHDMGLNSDWKHDAYKEHYPNGYELEWVEKTSEHEGWKKAAERNRVLEAAAEEIERENRAEIEAASEAYEIARFGSDG